MKIRLGFVSNSSSSSFSILRSHMSLKQYDHIRNHIAYAKLKKWTDSSGWSSFDDGDTWEITLEDDMVHCRTLMDNFDLKEFVVNMLGVQEEAIVNFEKWG